MKTFKQFLSESVNIKIEDIFKAVKANSKIDCSGGNCGQSAYAVYRFIKEKYGIVYDFFVLTNADSEEELINGEPDVYHIGLEKNNSFYDENGKIDSDYLLDLALDQYGNHNPNLYTFEMPKEEQTLLKIISTQTNYNTDWNYFYDILEKTLFKK